MEVHVPTAEDHCRISILVRTIGPRTATTFNRLIERLSRVEAIQVPNNVSVSDNPKRVILANFITQANPELTKFGDLQAHRKIFGFLGVSQNAFSAANSIQSSLRASVESDLRNEENYNSKPLDPSILHSALVRTKSTNDGTYSLDNVCETYNRYKQELQGGLVDSRCVIFGFNEATCGIESREVLSFNSLEDSEEFENGVRELIRSIYFILESRRIDRSFEKMEDPPFPTLPEEEKTRIGTENRQSKSFKRKCIGRLRKQVADYALLTGLPSLALDSYTNAIENLKASADLLWLAAAYEGSAVSAMAIKYNETADRWKKQATIHRVSTMTPEQMRDLQEKTQHNLGVTIGHQRYRSDEDQRAVATAAAAAAQLIEQDLQQRKQGKKTWALLNSDKSPTGRSMTPEEILEKFILALEHYERFSFASTIEYECMVRASSVYRHHRRYIEAEAFLREHVGKYLDDSFTLFDNTMKAHICMVYPILYRSLPGYGVVDATRESSINGPVAVQVKAMHEVYMSALRANFYDAAIRHLCYILQVYFPELDNVAAVKMLDELSKLIQSLTKTHSLAQHISLDQSGIILPPLQMTRFPTLSDFKIVRLSSQLAPRVISIADESQKIFIYSPFQNETESNDTYWVTNCGCEVSVKVINPLPVDLTVKNLALLTEGCSFEAVPVRLTLTPYTPGTQPTEIKLLGMPRAPGKLTITGYSCEVLGVRNVCSIKEILPKPVEDSKNFKSSYTVEVLQELPLLTLESSLQRAPTTEENAEAVAEITVFSGQTFTHSIFVVNTSESMAIKSVKLDIRQPTVFGPPLIELTNMSMKKEEGDIKPFARIENLKPKERREIRFQIFGIDPSSISDDKSNGEEQKVLIKPAFTTSMDALNETTMSFNDQTPPSQRNSVVSFTDDTLNISNLSISTQDHHDLIPYTGRLLTADFIFRYVAGIEGLDGVQKLYERTSRLPLAICIVPAVTVSKWHVLPGDSASTRYVVIDVANSTDLDAELTYSTDKRMIGMQPKEICRVPVLCPCCPDVSSRSFREATQYDSHVRQKQEIDILRRSLDSHIAKHLQIRWAIPQLNYVGIVPIGSVLAEVEFLKQLVVPTVSVYVTVNGKVHTNDDDISVKIGELVELEMTVSSILKGTKPINGELSLKCFQDLANGKPTIDRPENMVFCGPLKVPIVIESMPSDSDSSLPSTSAGNQSSENGHLEPPKKETAAQFSFLFLYEGTHKIRPVIGKSAIAGEPSLAEDEIFVPTITFNVITKVS
uniref:Trafficking protein particle complex subunit 11 n=1 Tax=Panagrolaimus superbus TaxID=310955 RepID=A0A914Z9L1_9BILA